MPYNTKALKTDGSGVKPAPQHFDPGLDDYDVSLGRNGASRVELYGPDGQPLNTAEGKLAVRAIEMEGQLTTIQGYIDGLEGAIGQPVAVPAVNTLLARMKSLEDKIDAITAGTTPAVTKLSGSKANQKASLALANAVAITDTAIHYYDGASWTGAAIAIPNFNNYNRRILEVHNTLDQDITLTFYSNLRLSSGRDVVYVSAAKTRQSVTIPKAGNYIPIIVTNAELSILNAIMISDIFVGMKCETAPTTGNIILKLSMWAD